MVLSKEKKFSIVWDIIRCFFGIMLFVSLLLQHSDIHSFGKNKVNRETFDWNVMKTIHFDIYYPLEMEDLVSYVAKMSEESYVHIANYLNHELTQVIPIIIYPSHIDFQENNILLTIIGEGTGGFTEAFKNRVVIPFTGSYYDFRHVLTHELVHAFQYNILFNDIVGRSISRFHLSMSGVPLWILEGMAEYLSIGFDETADMVMRDILYNEKYATLMDLTKLHVKSGYLLYKEGQAFFYFLEKIYGRDRIGELLRDIRDIGGYSGFNEAIEINTDKTLEELNLKWIRFYKKRYFSLVKDKKFDEEEGEQITFHQKTHTTFNQCPAVSPDGKRIAFLTNRNIYPCISVINLEKKKKRKIKTLVQGDTTSKFEGMHLLSNYLSWSSDGKYISFVSQSNGRDVIFLINSDNGKIVKEIKLPFRALRDPALSADGKLIAFIGQRKNSSDIYIYDIHENKLSRITNNPFSERYPKLSSDNSFIIFSSNWNSDGDYERDNYNLFKEDIKSKERVLINNNEGNDLQADLSPDDKKIIYISNRTGIYNAYIYDLDTGEDNRVTDVLCGIFYPRWFPDLKKIAFVAYQNLGYDIFVKDISRQDGVNVKPTRDTEYLRIDFPKSYFNFQDTALDKYTTSIGSDWLLIALAGMPDYGFATVQLGLSDYLGDHRLVVTGDYSIYEDEDGLNCDVVYYYLKYRFDLGVGIFRQESPIGMFSLSSINDIIHNIYWDTLYTDQYGFYTTYRYPFSRFLRFNIKASSSRYEIDYSNESERADIFTNLNQLALSLNFDNVLWGYMVPLNGIRGQIIFEHSFNITGQDSKFTNIDIDIRRYFLIRKKYVIALRASGGRIFGRDSEYFKYYLGGFNTLRGHSLFEYSGKNVFLFNAEFRFIFVEGIKFGWPLFFRIGSIGGVLFGDCGSAWDENYRFIDTDIGEFDDFKADMGFGFRFTFYPLVIFKLDFAWPYYYKSFDKGYILFSLGVEY